MKSDKGHWYGVRSIAEVSHHLASQYVRQLLQEIAPPVRFDVLSVYLASGQKKEFEHFKNAFGWSERGREGRR